jgi:pilus assembly protein CpaE
MLSVQRRSQANEADGPKEAADRPLPGGAKVVIVEQARGVLERISEALPQDWAPEGFASLSEAERARLHSQGALIIILGPSQVGLTELARVGRLLASNPAAGAILVVAEPTTQLVRLALRAGVNDAIGLSEIETELGQAVESLALRLDEELMRLVAAAGTAASGLGQAFVTSVFSPKGGVGKSVVAVNLAAALARREAGPVVVLDLDLQFGDVAVMLRAQPVHTIVDAVSAGDLLDHELLRSFLVRHDKSGVWVLAAPTSPSQADQVGPEAMLKVLELLKEMFAHVVIDTPPHLSEVVLQAVAASDAVAFILGMDVPSVKNASLGLQAFELLQLPLAKVMLLLNRAGTKVHLGDRDIERAIGARIDLALPSEVEVTQAVNQGNPVLIEYPRARFSAGADQLAEMVLQRANEVANDKPKR